MSRQPNATTSSAAVVASSTPTSTVAGAKASIGRDKYNPDSNNTRFPTDDGPSMADEVDISTAANNSMSPLSVESDPAESRDPSSGRPSGTKIALIMTPLCLSVLLSSLDITIVTPAIPAIVTSFQSPTGYAWVGGAFVLAGTAITPVWGSVADIWGRKPIMLVALALFLGGSLLCALAPQMDSLIAGRAVQGLGSSGMGTMVNVIICDTFPPRDRGLYLAITSIVWAIGSAVGPIIGGSFVTRLE